MKKISLLIIIFCGVFSTIMSQQIDTVKKVILEKNALKFNINEEGSHYFQVTFLNQTWL
jgi:hypothetical protein